MLAQLIELALFAVEKIPFNPVKWQARKELE